MGLFNRKNNAEKVHIHADTVQVESADLSARDKAMVEIEPHTKARQEVVEQTKKVNEHLKELLVENGFTIKIYLAAGGKNPSGENGKTKGTST